MTQRAMSAVVRELGCQLTDIVELWQASDGLQRPIAALAAKPRLGQQPEFALELLIGEGVLGRARGVLHVPLQGTAIAQQDAQVDLVLAHGRVDVDADATAEPLNDGIVHPSVGVLFGPGATVDQGDSRAVIDAELAIEPRSRLALASGHAYRRVDAGFDSFHVFRREAILVA